MRVADPFSLPTRQTHKQSKAFDTTFTPKLIFSSTGKPAKKQTIEFFTSPGDEFALQFEKRWKEQGTTESSRAYPPSGCIQKMVKLDFKKVLINNILK